MSSPVLDEYCRVAYSASMDRATLVQWRQTLGYTQQQLADALGVSQNTVSRWESGIKPIGNPVMLRLALERLRDKRRADIEGLNGDRDG